MNQKKDILNAKRKQTEEKITRVECKDGSFTYYNHKVGEAYHSPIGAALESKEKYVVPCNFAERSKENKITILDVCFGFGYNSAAAIDEILKYNTGCVIRIIGLELDKEILEESLALPFPFKHKELFEELTKNYDEKEKKFFLKKENMNIQLFIGDAQKRIQELKEEANIVFFDPFSPKKAPELWTKEFIKKVYNQCANEALLVTYSCARMVRENLKEAGFIVEDGPIVGRRGPATIGRVVKK